MTAVALSMPSSGVVLPFFFLACSSCHHLGYPCYLKHVSRVCLVFPQCVHFPPSKGPFGLEVELCFPITSIGDWPNL